MFENLYANIGKKIKNWAVWMFIIEALGAIIYGFILMANDSDMAALGIFVISLGPVVAFVSTWLLYGFGELIDKTCDTYDQISLLNHSLKQAERPQPAAPMQTAKPKTGILNEQSYSAAPAPNSGWKCSCGRTNAAYVSSCTCGQSKY